MSREVRGTITMPTEEYDRLLQAEAQLAAAGVTLAEMRLFIQRDTDELDDNMSIQEFITKWKGFDAEAVRLKALSAPPTEAEHRAQVLEEFVRECQEVLPLIHDADIDSKPSPSPLLLWLRKHEGHPSLKGWEFATDFGVARRAAAYLLAVLDSTPDGGQPADRKDNYDK